ncbi:MAG: RNA polymerase sigma factor [Bacteroidetes bacterium]|nr:RNA polymerase sigma factor [Bacteroidota bacterium]
MTDLLRDIQKKDKAAITLLYNRYGRKFYGYAVSKWQLGEDEAWDLVYKTLYKVLEVIDRYTFETDDKFSGFMFRAFVNNLRNHYNERKSKQVDMVVLNETHHYETTEPDDPPPDKTESSLPMRYLQEELQQLDDWKKILLLMRAQDYAYEEIATYVNRPADQLKVYYMRLKKQLTENINKRLSNSG